MTRMTIRADQLVVGSRFFEEVAGRRYRVEVVCPRGACAHERRDRWTVHLREIGTAGEWFSAHHDDQEFEIA
jgi:hypothetical protein